MQLAPMANGKDLELALRIKADLKQGQAELQQLEAALEQAGQQAQQTNAQLGTTTSAVDQLGSESSAAAAVVEAVGAALGQAGQQAQQAGAQLGTTTSAVDQLSTESGAATAAVEAVSTALDQAAAQAQQASTQLNTAAGAADQLGAESAAAAAAVKSVGAASATAATGLGSGTAATRDQQQALAALLGQIDPVVGALQRLDAMQDQLASFRSAGVLDAAGFDQYNAKLAEQRERLVGSSDAMKLAGLSAGEYRQAMRMLPMQLTDVATSLASGMPIWMVAIQQGGQIRDSFGGIGNAARAVMGALSPLAVAISAVVAGGAALLLAFQQGQQEASAYNQALIMTGNVAGTSADQLAGMAQRIDAVSGTQRQAAAALAEIAGTGKFAATQIEAIGTAAVAMENATGRAVSDTVAEFARLAEEPTAASAKLNQQYNYLTAAVYQQIRALEQQGDAQGAAQLAIEAYADAMQERAAQVTENLGYLERAWRAVGGAAAEAWDAMLDIGRADTLEEKLAGAYQELERLQKFTRNAAGGIGERRLQEAQAEVERLQQQIQERDAKALEQSQQAAVNEAGIEAVQQLDKAVASTASNAEKLKTRLEEIEEQAAAAARAGMPYSEEKLQQLRDAAAKQYTDPTSAGERYAENLRRQIELHGEASEAAKVRYAIERGELGALSDAQKQVLIADAEALDAKNAAAKAARDAEAAAKQQAKQTEQLARQQESYVAGLERQAATVGMTAEQVRQHELAEKGLTGALRARAEAALAVVAAGERQKKLDEDLARLTERSAQLQRSMASSSRSRREQAENELDGYGLGQRERERIASERDIRAEYQRYQDELNEATPKDLLGSSEYLDASAEIQRGLTAALDENVAAYDRLIQKQGDWSAGASEAFANYMAEAQDIAGQTEQMVGGALDSLTQGIGDSFAQAIVYGDDLRASLQGVAQTILAEVISALVQMGVRYAINAAMGQAASQAALASSVMMAETLSVAWAPAAAAASLATAGGNSGPAITGMGAAHAASLGFATPGFAEGGHVTGPGTGTSDDIPAWLSNDEFVTRSAVVRQPGALPFLEDFNRRGMSALDDWAAAVRHSTGGLAGVPAPALPAPSLGNVQLAEPAKALSATVNLKQRVTPVLSASTVADLMNTPAGEEVLLVHISKDPAKYRSALGL